MKRRKIPEMPPGPIVASAAGPEIDLHGLMAGEALERLETAIYDALRDGHTRLRVNHGKGTGALRRAVRTMLSDHPKVRTQQQASVQEGGSGVTIAALGSTRRSDKYA
ncbi:MAG: Smr/MutS family protein [Chloroflexi bacterium]|nr:Smr/MutS family protein [Chloroflexota bacterium]